MMKLVSSLFLTALGLHCEFILFATDRHVHDIVLTNDTAILISLLFIAAWMSVHGIMWHRSPF